MVSERPTSSRAGDMSTRPAGSVMWAEQCFGTGAHTFDGLAEVNERQANAIEETVEALHLLY